MEGSESRLLPAGLHKLSLLEQYPSQSDPRVVQSPHYCGLARIILCWGSCPGHCRIFGGILASAQQIQVEVPLPPPNWKKSKMFPDIAKCAKGKEGHVTPGYEEARFIWRWAHDPPTSLISPYLWVPSRQGQSRFFFKGSQFKRVQMDEKREPL